MSFFKFFPQFFPTVKAQEDDEIVDPQVVLKEKCEANNCTKYREKLNSCNTRVNSRSETTESCLEELMDLVHCVDHCVAHDLFSKLK